MDCSLSGSSVYGISQARILEPVTISFSKGSSWIRDWTRVSCTGRQIAYHWTTWKALLIAYVLCAVLSCSVVSDSLRPHGLLLGSSVHGDSPGKNTGVGCHALFQRLFPTQGSNPGLLRCEWFLYCLNHQKNPRILEWVAYPFSRGSSWPRDQTGVSCIACRFFTDWATREDLIMY